MLIIRKLDFKNLSLMSFLALGLSFVLFSAPAFAEGDVVCPGSISGTVTTNNANIGTTYFDAHSPVARIGDEVDLSILGLEDGLAPADMGDAACSEYEEGGSYDHSLKGYVWNDNLGFISLSCEGGRNRSGAMGGGAACGAIDYGVFLDYPNVGGDRNVFGHAWNPVVGFIDFDNGAFPNGTVTMNKHGVMSGYAWTEAGIWMDFSGVKAELYPNVEMENYDDAEIDENNDGIDDRLQDGRGLDLIDDNGNGIDDRLEVPVDTVAQWCQGKPYLCLAMDPDPFDLGVDDEIKVADGMEGYYVHIFLKEKDGVTPLKVADYPDFDEFVENMKFVWEDTVKADQTSDFKMKDHFSDVKSPWKEGKGAVVFKPLSFDDFKELEPGHYVTKQPVTSYAPTSGDNVSFTYGTEPAYAFDNEMFLEGAQNVVLDREPNNLIFKRIEHGVLKHNSDGVVLKDGAVYPNGRRDGLTLHFKPALDVSTLYANSREDKISASRGIPVSFRAQTEILGELPGKSIEGAKVNFDLNFSLDKTVGEDGGLACNAEGLEFEFLSSGNDSMTKSLRSLTGGTDFQAIATMPVPEVPEAVIEGDDGDEQPPEIEMNLEDFPCDNLAAPSLHTVISYPVEDVEVRYFSNKLPKTSSELSNPSAVIHGNVYGQDLGVVSGENYTNLSGSLDVSSLKDKVQFNLKKYNLDGVERAEEGVCTITSLDDDARIQGCANGEYALLDLGEEKMLYFNGKDVIIDLEGEGYFSGEWAIVANQSNVYVNSTVNSRELASNRLTLVALKDSKEFYTTGHGYLAGGLPMILDATMVFEGSLFSYNGDYDRKNIDKNTGVPMWDNEAEKMESLGYQALIRGAIYSDNTVGGADLDGGENAKNYLLAGAGEVIKLPASLEDRAYVQSFDLNYLRLFRLGVEECSDGSGLPVDQACGRCLSVQDMIDLSTGAELYGERLNTRGEPDLCNGINSQLAYKPGMSPKGDLVPPRTSDALVSEGLNNGANGDEFDPIYVFFRAPNSDSFLFK